MVGRVCRKSGDFKSPVFKSQLGAGCSLFGVARDSNIVRSRLSRKHASRLTPISSTVTIWQNVGVNEQKSGGRPFLPGASGRMDIFFLASADHWWNGASERSLPSLVRQQNSLHLSAPTTFAIPLPSPCPTQQPMPFTVPRRRLHP